MLQRYSVRLRIYSWFMKYYDPKLASAGVIAAFPVVMLVGANMPYAERYQVFQQTGMESIPEAWERLQKYILACPHHGMDEWLILQSF